jgi:hypothetical protein
VHGHAEARERERAAPFGVGETPHRVDHVGGQAGAVEERLRLRARDAARATAAARRVEQHEVAVVAGAVLVREAGAARRGGGVRQLGRRVGQGKPLERKLRQVHCVAEGFAREQAILCG